MIIKIEKRIRKIFVALLILGFFANFFSNFPFKVLAAKLGNDQAKEIILNPNNQDNIAILEEVKEARTTYEKTFKKSDGSLEVYYYERPIHEYIEDKGFEEIDSTFQNNGDEWSSDALLYNVKLPKKIHENKKIKFSYQNTKIEITYQDINKVTATHIKQENHDETDLTRLEGHIKYNDILEGVDLEYITNTIRVKENIIMKKYIENFTFSYNIKITNLKLIHENNYFYFLNESNEIIYQIDPYYMIDQKGNSSFDLTIRIDEIKQGEYKVEVKPNQEWLKEATYPVIIDPTINYNNNVINDKVTIKGFNKGNLISTIQNNVLISKYINSATNEDISRVNIMRLDISDLPKNVTYLDAKLKMYAINDNVVSQTVSLNEITSHIDFEEINGTTNYNKMHLSNQKKIIDTFYEFDIIDAIHRNREDDEIILEFSPQLFTGNDIEVGFYGPSSTSKPMLVINYYETSGLKDYWTYHSVDVGSAGVMYINDFSGNLVIEKKDYTNSSQRLSFNISHYYNSNEANINIGYGKGWRINYAQIMQNLNGVVGVNSSNYYTYIDGTGHKAYYKKKGILNETIPGSAYYLNEEGDDARIEIGASYTDYYRRIVEDEYIYKYNVYGELVFICDERMSNCIFIAYNELPSGLRVISEVSDSIGNCALFSYENDLLKEVTINRKKVDENGNSILEDGNAIYETALTITYEYDNNQNLISILEHVKDTNNIKAYSKYNYDVNGRLNSLYDYQNQMNSTNKEGVLISYNQTNKKVEKYEIKKYDNHQSLSHLPMMDITYQKGMTTFKDSNNYQTNYIFDSYGHTINVYDSDGYAQFYQYESTNSNTYLNNKVLKTSDAIYNAYNIINNHSFEKFQSAYEIPNWQIINGTSNLVKNVSLDSTNNLYGKYALRIKNDNQNKKPSVAQTIKLNGGKTYQLSYFAKVKENNGYAGGGAYIEIEAVDSSGSIITTAEEYVLPSDNYGQYIKSFTIGGYDMATYDVTIKLTTSYGTTAYFDNVSFVCGINDCRNNLLSDASFENSYQSTNNYFWTGGEVVEREPSKIYGNYEMLLNGNSTLSQTIDVHIKNGTTLSFGGYIQANQNKVKMRIRFYNLLTNTFSDYYTISFNDTISNYQYLVENVTLDTMDEAHQITVEIINEGNTSIYVDNLVFLEDVYKNTYEYNEYGKTTKVTSNHQTIHITRTNGRDINKIEYDNLDVNISESNFSSYDKQEINIEGTIHNVSNISYSYQAGPEAESIIGDISKKYFVTSTKYSDGYQYISSVTDEFGNTTKYEYDYVSGLLEKVIDAKNTSTNYIYDEYERLTQILTNSRKITYTYDTKGRVQTVEVGNLTNYIQYQFTYNGYNDIVSIASTSNNDIGYQNIISYEYYMYNDLYTGLYNKIIYPNGTYIRYEYDDKLNISKVFEKNDPNEEEELISKYIYNELGLVSIYYNMKDNIIYYNNYDMEGKLTKISDSNHNEIQYFYDDKANLSKIEYLLEELNGVVELNYDEDGNKNKIKHQGIETILENENDPLGRYFTKLVKKDNLNILTYQYTYDENSSMQQSSIEENNTNNLSSCRIEKAEVTVGEQKYTYQYTYDELGNIVSYLEIGVNTTTNEVVSNRRYLYEYDLYNQLTKEKVEKQDDETGYITILECNYTYDEIGNIISMNRTIKQNEYQTLPTHITYYYSDINNKTRLTSYSIDGVTFTITYDINGNPLEYYNYDVEFENEKLISLKENNQIKLRFTYDSNGKRTKKEIYNEETNTYDSVEYIYVGELLIGEKQDNQMIEYIYDEQNLVGFQITTGSVTETYYYVKNLQKDITKIIDETGKEVVSYIYDAYGNIVSTKGSKKDTIGKINPYRYRGYYYDIETGLFYCNSRYYNPEWGRWISPDSIEYLDPESINGLNLYCYCMNNPIMYVDPNGHAPKWWQSILIGLGVIAIAALATAAIVCSGGSATPFLAVAGQAALGGLKIATIAGATAGIVRAGKTAIEGGDIGDVGKSLVLGFSDGFLVGSVYAAGSMLLGAVSFRISGLVNNGYGWSSGNYTGGYQTPKTPGISLITHLGGINGGRSFGLDLDIYHGVHFHTNKFGIGKRSKWIKAHHWMFAPIGIGVGLSDGWSEW